VLGGETKPLQHPRLIRLPISNPPLRVEETESKERSMAALDKSIKDISKFEIRDIIDATENQLVHLQRSQTELLDALRETPDDVDFLEAVEENKGAIRGKSETVETMKNYLKEIDYAYYVEHYRKASAVVTVARIEDTAVGTGTVTTPHTAATDDGGMYL